MKIEERLEIVTEMLEAYFVRADIRESLKEVYDLERLIGRISFGTASGTRFKSIETITSSNSTD